MANGSPRSGRPPLSVPLNVLPHAAIVVDRQGKIVVANEATARLFDRAVAELVGTRFELLIPERYRDAHFDHTTRFFDAPEIRPSCGPPIIWALRRDGVEIPVQIGLSPVTEGRSTFVLACIYDLSHHHAIERRSAVLAEENIVLRDQVLASRKSSHIVGDSPAWARVLEQVDLVARSDSTVLLTGETGTGKELIARELHARSNRNARPLIRVNCASLPGSLIESELFGHRKGAFTGADSTRAGRFALADGGTIFLDEIGELPMELQSKLLHVLEDGEFQPLGADKAVQVDVRVITATNRNINKAIRQGRFRADLYYRLAIFPVHLPPLRDRPDDIQLLASYFLSRYVARHGRSITSIDPHTMEAMHAYDWPGNVRELKNLIERGVLTTRGDTLKLDPLILTATHDVPTPRHPHRRSTSARPPVPPALGNLQDVEREHITAVLETCAWKVKGKGNAAERLGLKESTLRSRMKKLGIRRPV